MSVRAAAVAPGEVAGAGEQALRDALQAAHVSSGIDDEACKRLARGLDVAAFAITDEIVARGTAPEGGESSRFEPVFLVGIQPGHVSADGTIDFFDRELLKSVQKSDVLGHMRPARVAAAGCLVDGTVIAAAPVKEAVFALGPGVECDDSGVVRAARPGVVVYKSALSLDVVPIMCTRARSICDRASDGRHFQVAHRPFVSGPQSSRFERLTLPPALPGDALVNGRHRPLLGGPADVGLLLDREAGRE